VRRVAALAAHGEREGVLLQGYQAVAGQVERRRHALQESADIIFCACGLRLDTSAEGGVSIAALQQRVDASLAMHTGSGCAHAPLLAVQSRFGLTMLQLSCARCNALQVVL
jgi:hypothetical protein